MMSSLPGSYFDFEYCFVGSGAILRDLLETPEFLDKTILVISNQLLSTFTTKLSNNSFHSITREQFLNPNYQIRVKNLIILTKSHRWNNDFEFGLVMQKLHDRVLSTVLLLSSGSVYGNMLTMCDEYTPASPISRYGISKVKEEEIVSRLFRPSKKVIILRVSNVYGNKTFDDIVNQCFESLRTGQTVEVFLRGTMVRDFLHINCLIDAILKLLEMNSSEGVMSYNISSGTGTSINSLLATLEDLTKLKIPVRDVIHTSGIIPFSVLDNSKILASIKWKPMNLEDGLRRYISQEFKDLARSL